MADRPYSRLYHVFADEYPHVFDDARSFGTWARLLVLADAAWPMTPTLPANIDKKALAVLVGAELVAVDQQRYRIRGLDKERSVRRASARVGGLARAEHSLSNRSPNAERTLTKRSAESQPSRDETRQDEPSRAREGLPHLTDDVALAWENATGLSVLGSGNFAISYLDDACRRHPTEDIVAGIIQSRQTFERIPTAQQLAARLRSWLDPLPNGKAALKDDAQEREDLRHRRAVENTIRRAHEFGAHADEADPRCPACATAVTA